MVTSTPTYNLIQLFVAKSCHVFTCGVSVFRFYFYMSPKVDLHLKSTLIIAGNSKNCDDKYAGIRLLS